MAVRSFKTSSISTGAKRSKFWDQSAVLSNASFESIATVTVPAGGQSSIYFGSIPCTYKHLQIRGIYRDTWTAAGVGELYLFPNSDTTTSYSSHWLTGNGSTAVASSLTSRSDGMFLGQGVRGGSLGSSFGAFVIDIPDYASTSKYKTARAIAGADINAAGGGAVIQSASWQKTNAISSLNITPNGTGFAQHTTIALYGIKG